MGTYGPAGIDSAAVIVVFGSDSDVRRSQGVCPNAIAVATMTRVDAHIILFNIGSTPQVVIRLPGKPF
jgi:hypothetical protein